MKVLFVENHRVFAETVTRQFLSEHDVTVVPSVAGAESVLNQESFEVALVDYDLDDGKGASVVKQIRGLYPDVKIVGVSARAAGNAAMLVTGAHVTCNKVDFADISGILEQLVRQES